MIYHKEGTLPLCCDHGPKCSLFWKINLISFFTVLRIFQLLSAELKHRADWRIISLWSRRVFPSCWIIALSLSLSLSPYTHSHTRTSTNTHSRSSGALTLQLSLAHTHTHTFPFIGNPQKTHMADEQTQRSPPQHMVGFRLERFVIRKSTCTLSERSSFCCARGNGWRHRTGFLRFYDIFLRARQMVSGSLREEEGVWERKRGCERGRDRWQILSQWSLLEFVKKFQSSTKLATERTCFSSFRYFFKLWKKIPSSNFSCQPTIWT